MNNLLPILYSKRSDGKNQFWQINVDGNKYCVTTGIYPDGKTTTSKWTEASPKNEGKSNETTAEEQALLEATSNWTKKKERKYSETLEETNVEKFISPMLATDYNKIKNIQFPVYVQPKLDGIRCIITKDGAFSRQGKRFYSVDHIIYGLKSLFKTHPSLVLDGELYNHKFKDNFNFLVSLIKRQKFDEKQRLNCKMIEYWVYDSAGDPSVKFKDRYDSLMEKLNSPYVYPVITTECKDQEGLDKDYSSLVQRGFEGQIIRIDDVYQNKRSKSLIKRKEFKDEEFEIVDIIEGKGNRSKMAGNVLVKTKDGSSFGSGIKGGETFYKEIWKNREALIGKTATIKYFQLTPDGIPRFPVCVKIDRSQYE